MKVKELNIQTHSRTGLIEITSQVQKVVRESSIKTGICYIFIPHTTAGVTINENADRSVVEDIKRELDKIIPFDDGYLHSEGNAAAHIKSSIIGTSVIVFIEDNRLKFGTWQGIFFCEFDGPRTRKVWVKVVEG